MHISAAAPRPTPQPTSSRTSDIATDINVLLTAATPEARAAITKVILEKSGVVVSDDPTAAPRSLAGLYVSTDEVSAMAEEAAQRNQFMRATFAEFARTFSGTALLPPNDGLVTSLPAGWPDDAGAVASASNDNASLDLADAPARLTKLLNDWVSRSVDAHSSDDPDLVRLTNAPLYLAELARRQSPPVDLRHPFLADDYHLGWLDMTLLMAGMRSMLSAVGATGLASNEHATLMLVSAAPHGKGQPLVYPALQAAGTPCDNLKHYLDGKVPLTSEFARNYVGQKIKEFVQSFVKGLAGETWKNVVRYAFQALGILARVQALLLLYSQATARVELDPTSMHKPIDQPAAAAATVIAGIRDDKWKAAKENRVLTPLSTAVRECARYVGLPVYTDSVTLGEAVKGWQVRWSLGKGAGNVQLPTGDDWWVSGAVPGRLQRPLSARDDHTGNDILAYQVLTENKSDHPGDEHHVPVELCAHIVPGTPPNGFSTILKSGYAGASLASGSVIGLVTTIVNLLTSWVANVHTIDACATLDLSFHVALQGKWRGTINVSTSYDESTQGFSKDEYWTSTFSREEHETITDIIYVGGDDPPPSDYRSYLVSFKGRQYTQGVGFIEERSNMIGHIHSGCPQTRIRSGDWGGGWSFDTDTRATLRFLSDGSYQISFSPESGPDEVTWPGGEEEDITQTGQGCEGHVTRNYPGPMYPDTALAVTRISLKLKGNIDWHNPPTTLQGSMDVVSADGRTTTHVSWLFTHDGPIPGTTK